MVENYKFLIRHNGALVYPKELSTGVKTLLMMKYTDYIMYYEWIGENCEKFIKEIADEKNLTISTTIYFNPFLNCDYDKVEIVNTDKVVYSAEEFTHYVFETGLANLME